MESRTAAVLVLGRKASVDVIGLRRLVRNKCKEDAAMSSRSFILGWEDGLLWALTMYDTLPLVVSDVVTTYVLSAIERS